jgi:hypothetical protein
MSYSLRLPDFWLDAPGSPDFGLSMDSTFFLAALREMPEAARSKYTEHPLVINEYHEHDLDIFDLNILIGLSLF